MFSWPLAAYRLTSTFGPRTHPVTGEKGKAHGGIDLAVPVGTPVAAVGRGTVGVVQLDHAKAGHYVEVDHGDGTWTRYLHLSRVDAKVGQPVNAGTIIGLSGGKPGDRGAGTSTGPHLHFELWQGGRPYRGGKAVDPLPFLTRKLGEAAVKVARSGVVLWGIGGLLVLGYLWARSRRRAAT